MSRPFRLRLSATSSAAFSLAALALLAVSARAADPLVWKFTKDAKNRYRLTQGMTMTIDLGAGGEVTTLTTNVMDMTMTVAEISDDGSAELKQRIDRIRMTMKIDEGDEASYDTASTDEAVGFAAMVAPLLQEMTRGEYTVTMTPRGKITDVEVPESLVRALAAAPGAAAMGELATAEGFKKMAGGMSFELPETLEPGFEWSTTAEMPNPVLGDQTVKTTYRYIGPKDVDGVVCEEFAPTLEVTFAGSDAAAAEVTEQKSSGVALFNRNAGRLESSQLDHSMTVNLTLGEQKMKQTLEQNVNFEWLPEDAE